jgi:hypothetical protein
MDNESPAFDAIKGMSLTTNGTSEEYLLKIKELLTNEGYEVIIWNDKSIPYAKVMQLAEDEANFIFLSLMNEGGVISFSDVSFDGGEVVQLNEVEMSWKLLLESDMKGWLTANFDKSSLGDILGLSMTSNPGAGGERLENITSTWTDGLIAIGGSYFKMPKPINWMGGFPLATAIRKLLKQNKK